GKEGYNYAVLTVVDGGLQEFLRGYPSLEWIAAQASSRDACAICQLTNSQPAGTHTIPSPPWQYRRCQHVTAINSPTYYNPWNGKCYSFFDTWSRPGVWNWTRSNAFCKGIGADLVSVHSAADNFWLT
ncbi:hypothetical protein AAVH_29533, partial [Aphelenchoides avenae]